MVVVAQLVRALDCGSRGRGFETRPPPLFENDLYRIRRGRFFCCNINLLYAFTDVGTSLCYQ